MTAAAPAVTGPATDPAAPILEAKDLVIEYATRRGRIRSLDAATLAVRPGDLVAVVGESGSGKTTLGMAAGRLLATNAEHVAGRLTVASQPVFGCDARQLRALRRQVLGFVFQNPVAALDPTMRIEKQMRLAAPAGSTSEALAEALTDVGLTEVPRVLRSFPHELSGGMAQRVAIAMVLRRRPRLLVADEPTASVDATLRNQLLTLLVERCRRQGCGLLLLTHDLHAVAEHTERIAVMYGGRIVEHGPTIEVLTKPRHPYTQALISALPGEEEPGQRLEAIRGAPPVLRGPSLGCAFTPRCPQALGHCATRRPVQVSAGGRELACHLHPGGDSGGEQHGRPTGPAGGSAAAP